MKLLHVLLLVVLAAWLPVRGAMAAPLPCPPAGGATHADIQAADAAVHGEAGHAAADSVSPHDKDAQHPGASGCAGDRCDPCPASCSLTPLPSTTAGVAEPPGLADATPPGVHVAPTRFVADAQERPPRSG